MPREHGPKGCSACIASIYSYGGPVLFTKQAISLLAALSHSGATRPHLVVVPLSTLPNWLRELARFAPQLNVVALTGK